MGTRRAPGEGSIGLTADGTRWRGRLTVDGKTRTVYVRRGATKAADKRAEAEVRRRVAQLQEQAKLADGAEQTVAAYLDGWLDACARRLAPNTVRGYGNDVRLRIGPPMNAITLRDLTVDDVQRMHDQVADSQGAKAANRALETLRAALERARRQRKIAENPAEFVDLLPERKPPPWPLDLDEAVRFLAAARGDRLHALWELMLCQGLREGEALGLTAGNVDLLAGTVDVWQQLQRRGREWHLDPLKGREKGEAVLPMPDRVRDALVLHEGRQAAERAELGELWWDPHGWGLLFVRPGGQPIHAKALLVAFRRLCVDAGVPVERSWRGEVQRRRVHDLRHSCGSLLMGLGYPQRVAMAALRHTTLQSSQLYTQIVDPVLREALGTLGGRLG